MKAIINGKILLRNEILEGKNIIFDDKIINITDEIPKDCEIIDANNNFVSPGLIDIHIHGNMGKDTMEGTDEAIDTISKSIARHGVTSYLPTTMTMDEESITKALESIKRGMNRNIKGATVIGAHLEGPFINKIYKGAQNGSYIVSPSYELVKKYEDVIKVITYAPEEDKNLEFTKDIKRNTNIVLSIGHSAATFIEARDAIRLGASNITHTFNGMTGLNHRDPGVVGAALTTDTYCEFICDTIHITKDLFQLILDSKTKDKVVLITDSMEAGGLEDGTYSLGGQAVIVKDGAARLESGSLAGSVSSLNSMVRNFYKNTNLKLNEAVHLASLNPARSIGIDEYKGSLDIGKDADIAIFDENLNCKMTISSGEIIFK
ncbi:N-acetylglucosamine-6-phosphate deacetylase,N-acetylglucosamine-6-phosphate deacetylase,N-acetylglucosamine-6-phosphate deacetylase,N-acyl-D-aspartate/D-glutamate deacylase,N-acetylglucosamine-6-phosphate deacetylase,Amidohydrolase family [[Clostridium] sordellii]|uniref:N-acetylglucosamine-6-phosphate deacetylase n=1 Tax=Paraclostridium sordellii TaxID=1505 RepID=UPI000541A3B1|nr:N-acetylglucosamine-6-phosphate deacetylase [Paeniclostridium sordellii]CEK32715.1 N-acetylglucosamine-6-phosphate deacetylase,N-acetylglucosamine-6-phosphate deacetylase,N-acetylglucosamine-6-phosphate deacetylase,N-acyl-D-aspartate/D-glutamate deacylase,N-acetylglucosamine-6-phosphate deacetylase,Amidohydrolase family [[Clostridium] sordellii] [Paeniclostridium sordellii]